MRDKVLTGNFRRHQYWDLIPITKAELSASALLNTTDEIAKQIKFAGEFESDLDMEYNRVLLVEMRL